MYLVLTILYESWLQPLLILTAIAAQIIFDGMRSFLNLKT